jgi:protein-disulfide isomerase
MAVVQKAAESQKQASAENEEKAEKERIAKELANPLQPELAADRAYYGPATAAITIVEYSDFQCPYCERGFRTMKEVSKAYGDKVRILYKHVPLDFHPLAMPAAQMFEAIALQSPEMAYKFHDEVFGNHAKLNSDGQKFLDTAAKKSGANMAQVKKDMASEKVKARIASDMAEAGKFGISGTPGFVVAGVSVRGAYPFATFKEIIDKKLASAQ